MSRFRYEVRREIPCAPYWAPVTPEEVRYLGLCRLVGETIEEPGEREAEQLLETVGMESFPVLDRTYLTLIREDGREISLRIQFNGA